MNKILLFSLTVSLTPLAGFAQTTDSATKKGVENLTNIYSRFITHWVGKPFTIKSFRTVDGKYYNQDSLKGKAVFYRFSFHYCSPCRAELPVYTQLSDSTPGVLFVYVTYDDTALISESFEKTGGMHHVLVTRMTAEDIRKQYYALAYPSSFWVDKNGIVRNLKMGGRVNHLEETRVEWKKRLSELASF